MPATNYTPISLYYSTTSGAVPLAANLVSGELALNLTDGKLYYKDNAGAVQLLSTSTTANGTANGVLYLNGSKVATAGSALVFDGTNLIVGVNSASSSAIYVANGGLQSHNAAQPLIFGLNGSEQMRLTSTGLGIGTSSPGAKLDVAGAIKSTVSVNVTLGGSDTGFAGPWQGVSNAGNNITWATQLSASNNLDWWYYNAGATSKRMTLDSSGNLGLGVTPSAWNSGIKAIDIGSRGALGSGAGSDAVVWGNTFYNTSSQFVYKNNGAATYYEQYSGGHYWFNAPSGTAGNTITFTQAMTLDASGNLGVATTNPYKSITVGTSNATAWITAGGTNVNLTLSGVGTDGSVVFRTGGTNSQPDTTTERARIGSSGNLLVGTTSGSGSRVDLAQNTGQTGITFYQSNNTVACNFIVESAQRGYINVSTGGTTYATSSDYRLKEQVQPMVGALTNVMAMKPVTYKWKEDGSDGQGFIAHELAEVCPQAVVGEKDAVDEHGNPKYQGVDTSFLVATLTAAIQEQQSQIESLRKRLADAGIA